MKRKVLSGLLVVFLWTTGIYFGTTTFPPKIVHVAKPTKVLSEMEQKRENRAIAKRYAQVGFGWEGKQWRCLESLWTSESRFSSEADNPRSSAYGIAQLLGESSSDPRIQVLRGLRYISHRHSDPCNSLRHFKRYRWY